MLRVKETILKDISSGKYSESERLPGVRELAAHYGCSRGTVSNVLRSLACQGVLRTEHGRGTFLKSSFAARKNTPVHMIGAVLLRDSWMEPMERLREEYLKQGWFVSLYCSSNDLQNPAAERHFLNLAAEQNFAGLILTATPREPLNTDLYAKLRNSGMKIVHLAGFKLDMSGEAAILPDYRMAGAVSCSAAVRQGKKYVVTVCFDREVVPPSVILRREGVETMARALDVAMLPEQFIHAGNTFPDMENGQLKKMLDSCGTLREVAVLAQDCAVAYDVRTWLDRKMIPEEDRPFLLSMSDSHWRKDSMNHIAFDYEKSVRMAMDYILDDGIGPLEPFQKTLDPVLKLVP